MPDALSAIDAFEEASFVIFDPFDRSVNVSGFVVAYGEPELAEAVAAEIGLGDLVELENGCLVAGEFDEEA